MSIEHKDYQGAKIGMWLFLFTEIILFGGLLLLYAVYRSMHPHAFHEAGMHLNAAIGIANTLILLTSSLLMASSITAVRKGDRCAALWFLGATVALGAAFLVNKFFEWSAKIGHGIYPNSPRLLEKPPGEILFYGLYYAMTGLHGIHVLIGIAVLSVMLWFLYNGRIRKDDYVLLENAGLYWHLVDVIWIFLLPLFYLAA